MIPVLFEIGPLRIHSYGLMLGVGFLLGSAILSRELRRRSLDAGMAGTITILAMVFGIAGAKLLYLIENWGAFTRDPWGMAFSPGGLTWYGGFVVGLTAITLYVRARKVPFLLLWDCLAPALMLAYGVARLGCHFSGDGDYGFPTDLPWGTNYENGTYPPSRAFAIFPEITSQFPGGIVPDNTPCHPTPVYELLLGILGFAVLWRLRTKPWPAGALFGVYLMLASGFRFGVEFLRINPRVVVGLSEAQVIALLLLAGGAALFLVRTRRRTGSPGGAAS